METTKTPTKRGVGRPRKYQSSAQLKDKIEEYFVICDKEKKPYTMTGLARALNLSRQGLLDYKGRPEFMDAITKARWRIEEAVESLMFTGRNIVAYIFWAKNNAGWIDKTELAKLDIPFEVEVTKQKEQKEKPKTLQDIFQTEIKVSKEEARDEV